MVSQITCLINGPMEIHPGLYSPTWCPSTAEVQASERYVRSDVSSGVFPFCVNCLYPQEICEHGSKGTALSTRQSKRVTQPITKVHGAREGHCRGAACEAHDWKPWSQHCDGNSVAALYRTDYS